MKCHMFITYCCCFFLFLIPEISNYHRQLSRSYLLVEMIVAIIYLTTQFWLFNIACGKSVPAIFLEGICKELRCNLKTFVAIT